MPAFGGRIPEDQLWQIVAYVRSLSGQLRKDVAPSRSDGMAGAPPENVRDEERPIASKSPQPTPAEPAQPASAAASAASGAPR
jgi:cytochrome c oxidase cbb3-type subunit 3